MLLADIEELISDSDAEDFDDREYERKSAVFGQFAFTKAETKLLMARAAEHLDVLSSEKWADYKEKRRIWQDITDELNAKNPKVKRTIMQVRRKWVNVRAAENPPRSMA